MPEHRLDIFLDGVDTLLIAFSSKISNIKVNINLWMGPSSICYG